MSHPTRETLAAYWLGDLPEAEALALEEHLFGCEACDGQSARMAALPRALSFALPPVVSTEQAAQLVTRDARISRTEIAPGGRGVADFSSGAEAQLMVLKTDLKDVQQVDATLCTRDGTPLLQAAAIPFDPATGSVIIACRAYYLTGGFPLELRVRLEGRAGDERRPLGEFDIDHVLPV